VPKAWNYWVYDPSGKLTEYRRGKADQIQNHDTNFKRDAQGRLSPVTSIVRDRKTSCSAARNCATRMTARPSISPSTTRLARFVQSTTQSVDDQGHVVTAVIRDRDWRTKQMKAPLKVSFRYDKKGRLIEQDTDAHVFDKSGSEEELPPGKNLHRL